MIEQAFVTIKEAAAILGASEKRIRRMVKSGQLRADLRPGKYGDTYRIDRAALPTSLPPGQTQAPPGAGDTRTADLLAALLKDTQTRLEGATVRLGQLEGEREQRLELAARAESAAVTFGGLRSSLRSRSWALAIALVAFVVVAGAALLRAGGG